jgi:hypothetical protein
LHCTISISFKFWNFNDRRLFTNMFLYTENDLSTSTEMIGAYLKNVISLGVKSSELISIWHIIFIWLKPLFLFKTLSNFKFTFFPIWLGDFFIIFLIVTTTFIDSVNANPDVSSLVIATGRLLKFDLMYINLFFKIPSLSNCWQLKLHLLYRICL